jgi:phosphatidylserine/phosphatidylglycerophosphate/cardiolipin synthase-like enzyme
VLVVIICLTVSGQVGCRSSKKVGGSESKPTPNSTRKSFPSISPTATESHSEVQATCAQFEIHYSPGEDLEEIDAELLVQAKQTIDMAAYSFTDPKIASVLEEKASEGVRVRVYSDHASAKSELTRAKGDDAVIADLSREPNIVVRIKHSSELAHMKSYGIDGVVLRTGSANFSPGAEKRQDNDLLIVRCPQAVSAFHLKFEEMWARPDNEKLEWAEKNPSMTTQKSSTFRFMPSI